MAETYYEHVGTEWENGLTPINEENLNKIEDALRVLLNNEIIIDGGTPPQENSSN